MTTVTDKVFFKGTPAQVCAIIQEYQLDSEAAGRVIDCDIVEPTEEVILPGTRSGSANADSLLERFHQATPIRARRVVLQPDSPRAVAHCYHGRFDFYVTALLCPENRTQITLRTQSEIWEDIKECWASIVGYMDNLGYLEDSEAVNQTKLLEPKEWTKELEKMGITAHSDGWWKKIEEWVRAYWERYGRRALPITGNGVTVESITGYERTQIYAKTRLGEVSK